MSLRDEILAKVRSIPVLPSSASDVLALAQDPEVSLERLCQAVERDTALTANVLRLANSAYFGSPRSVDTVRQALVRLGTKQVFQLVLAAAVSPQLHRPVPGYDLGRGEFWRHSIGMGVGAVELARVLSMTPDASPFSAGLLADVGKIVLGTFVEADMEPISELAFDGRMAFDEAERAVLGIDHAEVGAYLLDYWRLPPSLVEAARWHHHPEEAGGADSVTRLVHAADALVMTLGLGNGSDGLNYHVAVNLFEEWHLSEEVLEAIVAAVLEHAVALDSAVEKAPA